MDNSQKKILVVDDEEDLLDLLQMRLEANNYQVLTAADGQEGLDKARLEKPNLILLDVMMPKVNGFQACRELKDDPETKNIPVVMLTAKSQESDKFWAKETGANGYLTKPFEFSQLNETIENYLAS